MKGFEQLKNLRGELHKIEDRTTGKKRSPEGQEKIETMRKETREFLHANAVYLNKIDRWESEIDRANSQGAFKKIRGFIEKEIENTDKEKMEKIDNFRQKIFTIIAENNLPVEKSFLKSVANVTRMRDIKYLYYEIIKKYKLNEYDLENTTESVKARSGGLYGQGKSRKH